LSIAPLFGLTNPAAETPELARVEVTRKDCTPPEAPFSAVSMGYIPALPLPSWEVEITGSFLGLGFTITDLGFDRIMRVS
jgi:hypothetical protein